MRKKILLSFIIGSMALNLCSCEKSNGANDSTLTEISGTSDSTLTKINDNENLEEVESIDESEDLIPSSWEYYEENNTVPTPDSCVKGIFFKEISDDNYIYDLGYDSYDADMNFKAYGAALLGCGFTIEKEDILYMILDDSGETVAAMAAGKEDDSYLLMIYVW